jgi:hypothetical protein
MKSNKKAEIEEQIVSMLDKVMMDDGEEYDNNTIDTSLDNNVTHELIELRKYRRKSKTQANQHFLNRNGPIGMINEGTFLHRESPPKKWNTVNMQQANPMMNTSVLSKGCFEGGNYYMGLNRGMNNYIPPQQHGFNMHPNTGGMYAGKPSFYNVPDMKGFYGNNIGNNIMQTPMSGGIGHNMPTNMSGLTMSTMPSNGPIMSPMVSPIAGPRNSNLINITPMNSNHCINLTPMGSNHNININPPMGNTFSNFSVNNPLKEDNNSVFSSGDNGNLNDVIFSELERLLAIADRIDEKLFTRLKGNFISIIKTQNGSRVFQKYLKNTSSLILRSIFNELRYELNELMIDPYANYFCQKFFGFLEQVERLIFLKEVGSLLTLR